MNPSSKVEGRTIMVADLALTNSNAETKHWDIDEFAAYDLAGREYEPSAVYVGAVSSCDLTPGEALGAPLALDLPHDATVARIVWYRPVLDWVNDRTRP